MIRYCRLPLILIASSVSIILFASAAARPPATGKQFTAPLATREINPALQWTWHKINKMELAVGNGGWFGGIHTDVRYRDPFTGDLGIPGSVYPRGSGVAHLWPGSFWFGAVVGNDTLVSESIDKMGPDKPPFGYVEYRSILHDSLDLGEAVSEEDYICTFADTFQLGDFITFVPDAHYEPKHYPINVKVTMNSYAWSYDYAEDFILFHLEIENIGEEAWDGLYVGIQLDPAVSFVPRQDQAGYFDDISGFVRDAPSAAGCGHRDTLNIAWFADNDGDPYGGRWSYDREPYRSARNVIGVFFLGALSQHDLQDLDLSFNWWNEFLPWNMPPNYDFGPRKRKDFRNFWTGGLGEPYYDKNKYYQLRNRELDYSTVYTAWIPAWSEWMYPDPEVAEDAADGIWHECLLSIGPFDVPPGMVLPLSFAYVGGENFHVDPANRYNLLHDPETFYEKLDFSDLTKNALWARWIYDNPGVDTDGDGYAGEYRVCVIDSFLQDSTWHAAAAETTWYKGDGIPDWRAAGPPPPPKVWLSPIVNGIHVRFNGSESETEKDIFSHKVDFEGYRVYIGRDNREGSFTMVASYDYENYDVYKFHRELGGPDEIGLWQLQGPPLTAEELRCRFGQPPEPCSDEQFDPLAYLPHEPYVHPLYPDSLYYFTQHDYNASRLGITTPITKIYPDAPDPRQYHPDSIPDNAYTEDGYLKFFEYEFTITDLLSTVPYWVNVTAFDHGSSEAAGLNALETSVVNGAQKVFPLVDGVNYEKEELDVYIYPNPYRINADYRDQGYEGRLREDRPDYRVREVHFENLPPKCTIGIYSLDGDLVREIPHDMPESDPNHTHDSWDLITRNTQEPVSGLYYWVVEAPDGRTQIGKLVLIM